MKKVSQIVKIITMILISISIVFIIVMMFVSQRTTRQYNQDVQNRIYDINSYTKDSNLQYRILRARIPLYLDYLASTQNLDIRDVDAVCDALLSNANLLSKEEKEGFYSYLNLFHSDDVYENVSYYITDGKDRIYTNDKTLKNFLDNPKSYQEKMKDQAVFYNYQLDDKGEIKKVTTNINADSFNVVHSSIASEFISSFHTATENEEKNEIKFKPMKSMTFIFEIPLQNFIDGKIYDYNAMESLSILPYYNTDFIRLYMIFASATFIIVLQIPYQKFIQSLFLKKLLGKKGSLLIVMVELAMICFVFIYGDSIMYHLVSSSSSLLKIIFFTCVIAILLLPNAFCSMIAKKAYAKYRHKTLPEDNRFYTWIVKIGRNIKIRLSIISIKDNSKVKLAIYAFLNTLVITIMGFTYLLTAPQDLAIWLMLLIIYSIGMYFLLKHFMRKMQVDYETLAKVISRTAHGEFEGEIKEDLGIFTPMKESLQHLQNDFRDAVEQEVHSQKMKTELITNVSHDLKTPLTSMISYIDLLKDDTLSEKDRQKYLDILETSSNRLKHLIENLFEISKANSGNVTMSFMELDVISLIRQAELECESLLNKKHLRLRNQFADEKVMLTLDSQKTYRIFENLLSNVGKYALAKTRVYVIVEDYENVVEISIKNVSANELDFDENEIMERFTRGDKSRNTEGSGLGLAIAKSFTELQNGSMNIKIDGDLFKVIIRFYREQS